MADFCSRLVANYHRWPTSEAGYELVGTSGPFESPVCGKLAQFARLGSRLVASNHSWPISEVD